jgi:hypothetical protein
MNDSAFTRTRKLTFKSVAILILQKSLKSMQNRLNEFFDKLCNDIKPATASAFTQARSNLRHTAFIALNKEGVVDPFYADGIFKKWRNFRLFAIDGSKIVLPASLEIRDEFGAIATTDKYGTRNGEYNAAMASVLYDVLNGIAVDSKLAGCRSSELELAKGHLRHIREGDLLLADRNYPSFEFMASVLAHAGHFVVRCSRGSFREVRQMFDDADTVSRVIKITPHHMNNKRIKGLGLPSELQVRLVRVMLKTGEPEVLITSLLDDRITPDDFKELYNLRWGIETYYHRLKSHLNLENFSGLTVESVMQDFYAMVFLSGLESVLVTDAQEVLDTKNCKHPQRVNHAVSFNVLKNNIMELLYSNEDLASIVAKMTSLFLASPITARRGRQAPRKVISPSRSLSYQRRGRKIVF